MKTKILLLTLFTFTSALANEDVCCIFSGVSGNNVQTFARIVSSSDCKGTYQGKKVCSSVADPENTYCSSESSYKDRCGKCGYFWSGKECLTADPKEVAKKELEEEAKKKEAEKKNDPDSVKSNTDTQKPTPIENKPANDPDNPRINNAIPEEDSLFNRRSKGIKEE